MDSMVLGRKISRVVPLRELAKQVVDGTLPVHIGGTFHIDEAIETNRIMEQNTVGGKIAVLT